MPVFIRKFQKNIYKHRWKQNYDANPPTKITKHGIKFEDAKVRV